jgi:hypothetical protein
MAVSHPRGAVAPSGPCEETLKMMVVRIVDLVRLRHVAEARCGSC